MNETWVDIVGYEGLYQVSDLGRVKSLERTMKLLTRWGVVTDRRMRERIMQTDPVGKFKYSAVNLRDADGRVSRFLVHRLVLEAFVSPCPRGMECRHFPDRDPANNCLENLQWGTPKENAQDMKVHGTSPLGKKASAKARANMSAAQQGRKLTEEHKAKIGASLVGHRHSEKTKARIGDGNRGKVISQEQREAISEKLTGRKLSEEHRANISAGLDRFHASV